MEPSRTSHPPQRPWYYSPFICCSSRVCGILSYFHAASRGATSSIQRVQTYPAFIAACRRLATTVKDSSVLSSWCNADAKIESSEEQGKQRFWSRAVYDSILKDLRSNASARDKQRLQCLIDHLSGAWLTAFPSSALRLMFAERCVSHVCCFPQYYLKFHLFVATPNLPPTAPPTIQTSTYCGARNLI